MGTLREVKKRSATPIIECIVCHVTTALIGKRPDWLPAGGGHVCPKDTCRDAAGLPRFVPPDERR